MNAVFVFESTANNARRTLFDGRFNAERYIRAEHGVDRAKVDVVPASADKVPDRLVTSDLLQSILSTAQRSCRKPSAMLSAMGLSTAIVY